jgi:hypothetical protein
MLMIKQSSRCSCASIGGKPRFIESAGEPQRGPRFPRAADARWYEVSRQESLGQLDSCRHRRFVSCDWVVFSVSSKYSWALKTALIDSSCAGGTIGVTRNPGFLSPVCPLRGRQTTFAVELTDRPRAELLRWQRSTPLPAGLVRRGRLILLLTAGRSLKEAAPLAGLTPNNARGWVRRFPGQGVAGLDDQPGRGRLPVFSPRGRPAPG